MEDTVFVGEDKASTKHRLSAGSLLVRYPVRSRSTAWFCFVSGLALRGPSSPVRQRARSGASVGVTDRSSRSLLPPGPSRPTRPTRSSLSPHSTRSPCSRSCSAHLSRSFGSFVLLDSSDSFDPFSFLVDSFVSFVGFVGLGIGATRPIPPGEEERWCVRFNRP